MIGFIIEFIIGGEMTEERRGERDDRGEERGVTTEERRDG